MAVQVTSIISYYEVLNTLGKRHKEVLLAMKKLKCANNLMVSRYLNIPLQSVCGRMFELRKKGILIYHHTGACPIDGRTTRFFIIKDYISQVMG